MIEKIWIVVSNIIFLNYSYLHLTNDGEHTTNSKMKTHFQFLQSSLHFNYYEFAKNQKLPVNWIMNGKVYC